MTPAPSKWRTALPLSRATGWIRRHPRPFWGALILGGLAVRFALASTTLGTNDVRIWEGLRRHFSELGVAGTYSAIPFMNHPPLMAYYDLFAYWAAAALRIPFAFAIKVPGLAGELLAAWILYRRWSQAEGEAYALRVVAMFAWSLNSILVSGYHGNTDCLYAALCLLAAFLFERRRPGVAGIALAGALSVKLIPIVAVPVLAFRARSWPQLARIAAGAAIAGLPWIPFVILSGGGVWRNVLGYGSNTDHWGITGLLIGLTTVNSVSAAAQAALGAFTAYGKYPMVVLLVALAAHSRWRPDWTTYDAMALVLAGFLVLTPGFGIQYTAAVIPVLFAVNPARAFLYGSVAGVFALVTYAFWLIPGRRPLESEFLNRMPFISAMLGLVAWAILVDFCVDRLRSGAPAVAAQAAPAAERS